MPRYVELHQPDWSIDEAELRAAFTDRTRAIIVNTPHNPTGKVFPREELELIAELCQRHDVLCITDEIYEHIHYLGAGGHMPPATVPGLEDRTVTINALSKTYAVTGWRVGWTIAPPALTGAIRKVHDFLTVGAAAPLQAAGSRRWRCRRRTTTRMAADYRERRDLLCGVLQQAGFRFRVPDGAYYVLCDTSAVDPAGDDVAFAAAGQRDRCGGGSGLVVPPRPRAGGRRTIRFAFPKRLETLHAAADRLAELKFPVN